MASRQNGKPNEKEGSHPTSGSKGGSDTPSLSLIASMIAELQGETANNQAALMKLSAGIVTLGTHHQAFESEVMDSLVNITRILTNLDKGVTHSETPGPSKKNTDKAAKNDDLPF